MIIIVYWLSSKSQLVGIYSHIHHGQLTTQELLWRLQMKFHLVCYNTVYCCSCRWFWILYYIEAVVTFLFLLSLGFVTDGEFNSLRTQGSERPVSVIQLIMEAKKESNSIRSQDIEKYLKPKSSGMCTFAFHVWMLIKVMPCDSLWTICELNKFTNLIILFGFSNRERRGEGSLIILGIDLRQADIILLKLFFIYLLLRWCYWTWSSSSCHS